MRLQDKICIVTGAAGGIGAAAVRRFAQEGARVVAVDVQDQLLEQTKEAVNAEVGDVVTAHVADVSQASQVETLVAETASCFGRIDVIYSNAGIMRDGSVVDLQEEDWDRLFAVNVKGSFLLGKYGIPEMRKNGKGSFIITASANSFYAESDIAGYCATKGAAMQLARAMAIDHGPEGIRVNCICPGWIETPMAQPFLEENPEGRAFAGTIAPLGRIGQPEEVAEVALCDRRRLQRRWGLDRWHDQGARADLVSCRTEEQGAGDQEMSPCRPRSMFPLQPSEYNQ